MEVLKELVQIVSPTKLRKIELLSDVKSETLLYAFYQAVQQEKFHSDEQALRFLYPKGEHSSSYRSLKASLKQRLINQLFFLDVKQPRYTDRQRAYYEAFRNWAASKILFGKNARSSAVELAGKTLKAAEKYEFTELIVDVAHVLRHHHGGRLIDRKSFQKYHETYQTNLELFILENEAEEYYTRLLMEGAYQLGDLEPVAQMAEAYVKLLRPKMVNFRSYRLHLYFGLIELSQYTSRKDYRSVLKVCDRIISFFESKPYQATTPLVIAWYQKLNANLELGQFPAGEQAARQGLALEESGTFNWFKMQEMYLLLAIRTKNYSTAQSTYQEVVAHQRFGFQNLHIKETWRIYAAYLHFLFLLDKIEEPPAGKFRLSRFLNNIPIYSKDKAGFNISIQIAQLLILFGQGKHQKMISRAEAVEKYSQRYLKRSDHPRAYYFLQLLLLLPQTSFHPEAVKRKAKTFLPKLERVYRETTREYAQVEIIPFEHLWNLIIKKLTEKQIIA